MSEEMGVVATLVDDMPEALIPGCVERSCVSCRRAVWLSPASQETRPTVIVCVPCAVAGGVLERNPIVTTPAQIREYVDYVQGHTAGPNTIHVELDPDA